VRASWAGKIILASRSKVKLSFLSHYVGNARAKNIPILDDAFYGLDEMVDDLDLR
jgi:hypothetical protein